MKKIIFFILLSAILFSCGFKDKLQKFEVSSDINDFENNQHSESKSYSQAKNINSAQNTNLKTSDERKLIKEGWINFETKNIIETRDFIEKLIQKYQGYISEENTDSSMSKIYYKLILKIPKGNFDALINDLAGNIKKINSKAVKVQDVTEEFIDIKARLKVKTETEKKYLQLLNEAKNIKDILDIQDKIQQLRSEIESIEGRLRYLNNSINFSTLEIRMNQKIETPYSPSNFFKEMWEAIKKGVEHFGSIVLFLLEMWSILVIAIIIFFFVKKLYKKNPGKRG